MDIQQPHSQPPLGRYEPNHASEHSHNGDHTLNSSTLPYRPRPDAPETTYPNQQPYPGSEPSKPTSYMGPPPHPSGPTQGPLNTSSSTLYNLNDTTSSAQHLAHVSPQPIPGPGLDSKSEPPSVPGPDAAASTTTYPPPNHYGHATASPPAAPADAVPNAITTAAAAGTNAATDIRAGRASAESALHELLAARRQRLMVHRVDGAGGSGHVAGGESDLAAEVEWKVRSQTGLVLFGLRGLQERVGTVLARAEGERWRRWGVGGVIASIIPLVKRLFRRRRGEDDDSSNRTEYAFKKSRNLVSRILATTNRPGLGTVAFFVFAVLYIFQNEVTLRVARTVSKRLKRLAAKVEDGREELTEHDVKVLQGWRWRVLAWSE